MSGYGSGTGGAQPDGGCAKYKSKVPVGDPSYLPPGKRLPAICYHAYTALLQVYGYEYAIEFMRWTVVDLCGEEWVETAIVPPDFPKMPES